MPVKKMNPTSPGRRQVVKVVKNHLHKGDPYAPLVITKKKTGGRNNQGRITTRHKGGGAKQKIRLIDFKRSDKDGIPGKIETIEHNPNGTAYIARVVYLDGERRYIIAPKGMNPGDPVISGAEAPIKVGNCLPIRNIPVGTVIHCVELKPGKGAQLSRSAGTSIQLAAKEGMYATLKLRSGAMYKVLIDCRATIGEVGNDEHNLISYGKAGAKRWKGIRPTVRGVAMNPVDHPMGGGEGKTSGGRHPCTPWGVPTKGYKTRKNKRTEKYIVRSRHQA